MEKFVVVVYNNEIWERIPMSIWDEEQKYLDYENVVDIIFDKAEENLVVENIKTLRDEVRDLKERITALEAGQTYIPYVPVPQMDRIYPWWNRSTYTIEDTSTDAEPQMYFTTNIAFTGVQKDE